MLNVKRKVEGGSKVGIAEEKPVVPNCSCSVFRFVAFHIHNFSIFFAILRVIYFFFIVRALVTAVFFFVKVKKIVFFYNVWCCEKVRKLINCKIQNLISCNFDGKYLIKIAQQSKNESSFIFFQFEVILVWRLCA